jgi:hypothetical protein
MNNILLAIGLVILASCSQNVKDKVSYRFSAEKYLELAQTNIDSELGLRYLDTVLIIDTANIEAYSYRGIIKYNKKDFKGALEDFNKLISIDSLNAQAYYNRGALKFMSLKDTVEACKDWAKAKRLGSVGAFQVSENLCDLPKGKLVAIVNTSSVTDRESLIKKEAMESKRFILFLAENKVAFKMPAGYKVKKFHKNITMPYQYAIVNPEKEYEMRIYVEPLTGYKKEKAGFAFNNIFESGFLTALDSLSKSHPSFVVYEPVAVKPKFNADVGLISHFRYLPSVDYAEGYKYGTLIVIHKDNVADIYLSFLYNTPNRDPEVFKPAEESIRFL